MYKTEKEEKPIRYGGILKKYRNRSKYIPAVEDEKHRKEKK